MLALYEDDNRDLRRSTRVQLAVFVLAPKVGIKALEALFERPLGKTPFRHRSWMWYTAMNTSGLEPCWDRFATRFNSGESLHDCLMWLKSQATDEQWATLSRRLGVPTFKDKNILNPYWWKPHPRKKRTEYWTRGGTWDRRNPFTKVIIFGESIERGEPINTVCSALSDADLRTLEREVCNVVDEDRLLYYDAVKAAVQYLRWRIPDILGYKRDTTSYKTVSWFFKRPVPYQSGAQGEIDWRLDANYPRPAGPRRHWGWFPKEPS